LLKPIKGVEEELEANLRSFFSEPYAAPLQFVFSSTEAHDPGIEVARRVAAEFPERDVRFVVSDAGFGHNPKVSNLAGALSAAEHDLVLQSDANVRIRPGYLEAVVREFEREGASLLGTLVAGRGERSLGAALENVQLSTFITPGICLARRAGVICVIGKAIVFRKSELDGLGGIALVKDVLAEDFLLGELYAQAGKRVVVSRYVVDNVNVYTPLSRFLARHARWLKMRVVVHAVGFGADLLSNASLFALLAAALSGFDARLLAAYAGVVAYKIFEDGRLLKHLRAEPLAWRHVLSIPLRDLLLPCLWFYAAFSRTTEWRGERFRLSRGSVLTPVAPVADRVPNV
jgi:ceramide glucosyltransferase